MIMGSLIRKRIMAYYASLYNWFPYNPQKTLQRKHLHRGSTGHFGPSLQILSTVVCVPITEDAFLVD